MMRPNLIFITIVALLVGLMGGVLLSQTKMGKTVLARESFQPKEFVSAKEFRLIDANDRTVAVLGGHPGKEPFLPIEPALRFYGNNGELVILLGIVPGNKPKLALFDGHGKTIWETP
ncbi:MAG: hypothetical protein WBG91_21105 [Syntrophobacteria bacterium]|jgi:hypothetical protein